MIDNHKASKHMVKDMTAAMASIAAVACTLK